MIAAIKYIDNWENSYQVFTQYSSDPNGVEDVSKSIIQNSINDEFEKQWLFQVDYVKPIGEDGNFETGVRTSFRNMLNDYVVNQQNASGDLFPCPGWITYLCMTKIYMRLM